MGTPSTTGRGPRLRGGPRCVVAVVLALIGLVAGCSGGVTLDPEPGQSQDVRAISIAHDPQTGRIGGSGAAEAALAASRAYFESAQVVVLAPDDEPAAILRAASIGAVAGAPVLLTAAPHAVNTPAAPATSQEPGELNTELVRLGVRAVLTVGAVSLDDVDTTALIVAPVPDDDRELSALLGRRVASTAPPESEDAVQALARLDDREVFAAPNAGAGPHAYGSMPVTKKAQRLSGAVVIARNDPLLVAAVGTAAGAGARVLVGSEPLRGDADLINALGEQEVTSLVAMGEWDVPRTDLDATLAAVRTGVQLPGGGQLVFGTEEAPLRYVSLYGSIQTDKLGPLGEQDAAATMQRTIREAAAFTTAWDTQVVPAVEILVTVAGEKPGASGKYSHMWPAADIEPWIEQAERDGVLVLLTFQPGRYSFPEQVHEYASLLAHPNVGVRLEPRWRYETAARANGRSGAVDAGEVNDVVSYLSEVVASHDLPQKVVAISQSSPGQVRNRGTLITDDPRVPLLITVETSGDEKARRKTWTAVREDAPAQLGWGYTITQQDASSIGAGEIADVQPLPDWVSRR